MTGRGMTGERAFNVAQGPGASRDTGRPAGRFTHAAIFYGAEDLGELGAMLSRLSGPADPVHLAVPDVTRQRIGDRWQRLPEGSRMVDMTELGRNPARVITDGQSFVDEHPGRSVSCIWEPAWPSRSPAELREVVRHEALCNLAFAGLPMSIFCLYDTAQLSDVVIADAELTHPVQVSAGERRASRSYLGAGRFPPGCDEPLPPPAENAEALSFDGQLGPLRQFSADKGRAAGLDRARVSDLVLAVSEIAANALGHAGSGGLIRSWCTSEEILCQVEDRGYIADPLAGRYQKPADAQGGHGLWLVNRVCDLVERRSGPTGTITRLHMRRPASRAR